jgi:hypothetical protein
VIYQSYRRSDGLWDIEAELRDEKAEPFHDMERGLLQPGTPIHDMAARVTIDDDMVVRAVEVDMRATPFSLCGDSAGACQSLVVVGEARHQRRARGAQGRRSQSARRFLATLPRPLHAKRARLRRQAQPSHGCRRAQERL